MISTTTLTVRRAVRSFPISFALTRCHDSTVLAGTSSILAGTMKRLNGLTNSKDSRHMLYLMLFVIVVLLMLWRLTK